MYEGNAARALAAPAPELTVLSFGGGQDSTALLYLYAYSAKFREMYAPGNFIVVMAETMDEHEETYSHVSTTRAFCERRNIPFVHITPDMGFHPPSWQGLNFFYDLKKAVGSKAFPKTCTDNLKLIPIYRYLEQYLGRHYGVPTGRKKGFYEFARQYGKVRVLIGIAKGEEKRMADPEKETKRWKRECAEVVYPLVDMGLDRAGCQTTIKHYGHDVPLPSNCKRCPFMSEQELLWLYRFRRTDYDDWVRQERVKLDANQHMGDRNLGVWGKKTLPEVLEIAQKKYGHWSNEQLHEYKMSHGHCVASKY